MINLLNIVLFSLLVIKFLTMIILNCNTNDFFLVRHFGKTFKQNSNRCSNKVYEIIK